MNASFIIILERFVIFAFNSKVAAKRFRMVYYCLSRLYLLIAPMARDPSSSTSFFYNFSFHSAGGDQTSFIIIYFSSLSHNNSNSYKPCLFVVIIVFHLLSLIDTAFKSTMSRSQLWIFILFFSTASIILAVASGFLSSSLRPGGKVPNNSFLPATGNFRVASMGKVVRHRSSRLFQTDNSPDNDGEDEFWANWIETRKVEDLGLLVGDIVAIFLASQLMGLLDVVNDPDFVRNGGWFQPIPAVPSTLGVLIERISTLSLVWILSALSEENSFSYTAVESEKASILMAFSIVVNFVALRLLLGWTLAFATNADFNFGILLRDCYFVTLLLPGFRFLYSQYVR
jgi:hypothetical protein